MTFLCTLPAMIAQCIKICSQTGYANMPPVFEKKKFHYKAIIYVGNYN